MLRIYGRVDRLHIQDWRQDSEKRMSPQIPHVGFFAISEWKFKGGFTSGRFTLEGNSFLGKLGKDSGTKVILRIAFGFLRRRKKSSWNSVVGS